MQSELVSISEFVPSGMIQEGSSWIVSDVYKGLFVRLPRQIPLGRLIRVYHIRGEVIRVGVQGVGIVFGQLSLW